MKRIFVKLINIVAYLSLPSVVTVFLHKLRGVKIDKGVRIHRFVYIDDYCPENITIGKSVGIGVAAKFIAHDRDFGSEAEDIEYKSIKIKKGYIHIEDFVYIGVGAIILPNVTIGRGAVVGAGAIVNRDVPPNTLVAGVPAREIRQVRKLR